MKNNYFKSYFKAFGVLATVLVVALFAILGYVLHTNNNILDANFKRIIQGSVLAILFGGAIACISGLKNNKVGFADLLRVGGLFSSVILAIIAAVGSNGTKSMIVYIISAVIYAVLVGVRLKFADDDDPSSAMKNYFGVLVGTYNPLIIGVVGLVIAVLGLALHEQLYDYLNGIKNLQAMAIGASAGAVVILFIPALDEKAEVTVFDFVFGALFVASTYLAVVGCGGYRGVPYKVIVLLAVISVVGLLARGLTYTKGKGYENTRHTHRIYFKQSYEKYSAVIAFTVAGILVLCAGLPFLFEIGNNAVASRIGSKISNGTMIFSIVNMVGVVALLVLLFVFRNFKSSKIEKVDGVLMSLLYASAFVIPAAILAFTNMDAVSGAPILFAVLGVNLVALIIAAAVQFIRLRNFNPIDELVTKAQYNYKKQQEAAKAAEEEAEEEVEEEAAPEDNDPFKLTDEDEELFNSYYGVEEKEPEEEKVEYVEMENPQETEEDVEYVEEEVEYVEEEVPAEEEYVEEVVEEAPVAEEPVQEEAPAEEEEVEADEEEAEDEEDETEEVEEEDAEEVVEEIPHKTSNVIVNDFQVVDENGEPKKIKRRFNTKMMYAPYETQEYYNEIKNYLMMYRAKGRYSSRCETFRYKGLVAKVALGGKSIKVFLALDPEFVIQNPKYHLKDVSDKKQYQDVPVMIKVRSPRGLKYFKELVDIMMANRLVKAKRNYQPTDFLPTLIPNGEAILATLGMSTDYLHSSMNVRGIPEEMPDNLIDYIPMAQFEPLEEEEVEVAIFLDTLCNHFEDGAEITLDVLKELNILTRGNTLRIKARGTLDRKLTIYAENFDEDALKMLMCTNCTAVRIIR